MRARRAPPTRISSPPVRAATCRKGVRFQVCLPTPMAVIRGFCTGPDVAAIERAYEAAMIREAQAVCAAIPHADLCIQWDVCYEMIAWDGQPQDFFPPITVTQDDILAPFPRLCAAVPDGVELGFHLCYGDFGAKHAIEPKDAGRLVEISNALAAAVKRADRLHPHAGAARAQRCRLFRAARRPQARGRHEALSRRGA